MFNEEIKHVRSRAGVIIAGCEAAMARGSRETTGGGARPGMDKVSWRGSRAAAPRGCLMSVPERDATWLIVWFLWGWFQQIEMFVYASMDENRALVLLVRVLVVPEVTTSSVVLKQQTFFFKKTHTNTLMTYEEHCSLVLVSTPVSHWRRKSPLVDWAAAHQGDASRDDRWCRVEPTWSIHIQQWHVERIECLVYVISFSTRWFRTA